ACMRTREGTEMSTARPGLQLPVMAMSLVIPVAAFHNQPGCVGKSLRRHVAHPRGLVFFAAMSGGDLQEQAGALRDHLDLIEERGYAVIDGMGGPWVEHLSVKFESPDREYRPWLAYLVENS